MMLIRFPDAKYLAIITVGFIFFKKVLQASTQALLLISYIKIISQLNLIVANIVKLYQHWSEMIHKPL